MRVLHVCSELYPLLKTGGLADVLGALPFAQQRAGMDVRVLLPAFPSVVAGLGHTDIVARLGEFPEYVTLRYGRYRGLGIYLLDAPYLYGRSGNPYHDDNYQDYADNYKRFAFLAWAGAELAVGLDALWRADVVHAHDWHAGLTPAYLAAKGRPAKSVFTIHNLAYQGCFDAVHLGELGLPHEMFSPDGLEWHGQISYLKAGLFYADVVTAVSPTYAREITTPEFSYGFDGLLNMLQQQGRLKGILNGVDAEVWNPATDQWIAARYDAGHREGKAVNKAALQQHFGLPQNGALLLGMVTRLTDQKGVDLLLENVGHIIGQGGQLVVLGSGNPDYQRRLLELAAQYPQQIGVVIGYDETLSHLITAGSDVILVPSRFEPCGLTQLYGLKYGTLPLVRRTGGLADTVVHADDANIRQQQATGFVFEDADVQGLRWALDQAFALWKRPDLWDKVQNQAMHQDFSWELAAQHYDALYRSL